MKVPKLNLPPHSFKLTKRNGQILILDEIRRKQLVLTPEEWVRQHFVHFLIGEGIPKGLVSLERGLVYNQLQKRSDILVFDRTGSAALLVECKAPNIAIDQTVLQQALNYQQTIQAKAITLTNGLNHVYLKMIDGQFEQVEWADIIGLFGDGKQGT